MEKNRIKLYESCDNIKLFNIHVTRIPEAQERETRVEETFEEIMAKNVAKMLKYVKPQIQEVEKSLSRKKKKIKLFKLLKTNIKY